MKVCVICKQEKSIELFGKGGAWAERRCKRCLADRMKKYVSKNKEHISQQLKDRRIKNPKQYKRWTLNSALKEYPKVNHAQIIADLDRNKCAVCGASNANSRRLEIDHDHLTGAYRGVLCLSCNLILGHSKDDPQRLLQLRDYLLRRTPGLKP